MHMSIANNIKSALPKTKSAKEFMKSMEECSQTADKSLARTLMNTLTTMKFDGSRTMHEYAIELTNIAAKLKKSIYGLEQLSKNGILSSMILLRPLDLRKTLLIGVYI